MLPVVLAGLLGCSLVHPVHAEEHNQGGGVALGATRLIYPQGDRQASITVNNSSDAVFLIQSWVSNADGSKSQDFVLTPPLFVMHSHKENTLRVMYVGPELPTDRESVFYLNNKAIPTSDKNASQGGNALQIATQAVIKLFVRPPNLPTQSVDVTKTLRCSVSGGKLTITNPSPYYVSIVQFFIGGRKLPNTMVPPKGDITLGVPGATGQVTLQTVNDYGADTPVQHCI